MTAKQRLAEQYGAGNLEAARIILETPERYGGEQAALVQWARVVVAKSTAPRPDAECGPLFSGRAA